MSPIPVYNGKRTLQVEFVRHCIPDKQRHHADLQEAPCRPARLLCGLGVPGAAEHCSLKVQLLVSLGQHTCAKGDLCPRFAKNILIQPNRGWSPRYFQSSNGKSMGTSELLSRYLMYSQASPKDLAF